MGCIEFGEAIDPVEIYRDAMVAYYQEMTSQACAWYLMTDAAAFDRTDVVGLPETRNETLGNAPAPYQRTDSCD